MTPVAPDTLLHHLGKVYAFAQLVTPDPTAAARLVRATYERAFDSLAAVPEGDAGRFYLYRLLLDVRREERGEPPTTPAPDDAPADWHHDAPDDLAASRERHAHRFIELHLPPALVSLNTSERLLLLLCDVEGLDCAEAARVLGVEEAVACARYQAARDTLRQRVLASVSVHERAMTDELLTSDTLRRGILTAFQEELTPVPAALRATLDPPPAAPPPGEAALPPSRLHRWVRAGYAALLLTIVGLSIFLLLRRPARAEETSLVALVARHAADATVNFQTRDALEAQAFVELHMGWRLSLPDIQGYTLDGTGLADITDGVSVPVFRYTSDDGDPLTLYVLTYSMLDQTTRRATLEPDVLRQLEDDQHFDLHDVRGTQVLLWRSRDDVYLAVTPTLDPSLAQRITP